MLVVSCKCVASCPNIVASTKNDEAANARLQTGSPPLQLSKEHISIYHATLYTILPYNHMKLYLLAACVRSCCLETTGRVFIEISSKYSKALPDSKKSPREQSISIADCGQSDTWLATNSFDLRGTLKRFSYHGYTSTYKTNTVFNSTGWHNWYW